MCVDSNKDIDLIKKLNIKTNPYLMSLFLL